MTKIANKPFIEAFSDTWAWCDFWARVAFSTRRCSSVPARRGPTGELGSPGQAGSWERPVPAALLGKCQPKHGSRDPEMPGHGTAPSLPPSHPPPRERSQHEALVVSGRSSCRPRLQQVSVPRLPHSGEIYEGLILTIRNWERPSQPARGAEIALGGDSMACGAQSPGTRRRLVPPSPVSLLPGAGWDTGNI